jgi:glucose-6-phosphate isomerase
MIEPLAGEDLLRNPAALYACARNLMRERGRSTEIMVTYEPKLVTFSEWWKQLFGESEGKESKEIFPASVLFFTDLHSLGQWIQEGSRTIFETVIRLTKEEGAVVVPPEPLAVDDGLGYLQGKPWPETQVKVYEGTKLAHHQGGGAGMVLEVPELDARRLGQMIYSFEKACGISGYLLGVDPFNQPGVEAYKNNIFALLGKPSFEEKTAALEKTKQGFPRERSFGRLLVFVSFQGDSSPGSRTGARIEGVAPIVHARTGDRALVVHRLV